MLLELSRFRFVRTAAPPVASRVLVINGHPDPSAERYCAALCSAVREGAGLASGQVRTLNLGSEKRTGELEAGLERLWWSNRLFVVYPVWFGGPPPALRRLFDAFARQSEGANADGIWQETQIVATASLPSLLYQPRQSDSQGAPPLAPLAGIETAATTIIGSVDTITPDRREQWLAKMRRLGARQD